MRIVVPRHIHHMPGSGGSELSWGRGEECAQCSARSYLQEPDVWEVMNKTGKIGNTGPNPASCSLEATSSTEGLSK